VWTRLKSGKGLKNIKTNIFMFVFAHRIYLRLQKDEIPTRLPDIKS
jgi:hypothetical protein